MLCPNCKEKLNEEVADNQSLLHCSNCGGTFFQENGINRITITSAQNLAQDLKLNQVYSGRKLCPNDNTILAALPTGENIPEGITMLHCPSCKGVFVNPNDLVLFKKAQTAKIDYFKIWNMPLPSIRSVAILSIFLFATVLSLTAYTFLQKQNLSSIQADEQISNVYTTTSDRYLFVSFKTESELKSKIIFNETNAQKITEKTISDQPVTFHQLTTGDLNLNDDIYYQIILTGINGQETRTEFRKLEIK